MAKLFSQSCQPVQDLGPQTVIIMLIRHDGIAVVVVTEVVALVHVETEPRIGAIEMRNGTGATDTQGRGRGRDFENNRNLSGHLSLSLVVDLTLDLAPVPKIKERNRRGDAHYLRAAVIPMMEENDGSEIRRTGGKKVESGGKRKRGKRRKRGARFIFPLRSYDESLK